MELRLQVVLVAHALVNELAIGGEVEDPVGHGLHQLVVVGGHQHVALDRLQAVVQSGDGLQVQVVGGLVQQQHVGPGQHHAGEHAPHLLTTGEHLHGLEDVVAGEEHPAQEAPEVALVLVLGELAHPVQNVQVTVVEEGGVVLGEVGEGGGLAPLHGALVGLPLAGENLKEGSVGVLVVAYKGDLVPVAHDEGHLVQHLHAVHGLGHVGDEENVLAHFPVGGEAHPGVAAGGGGQLLDGELVQQLAAGSGLLGLGLVGGESGDKLLEFLDLVLVALVLLLDEVLHQLGGLVPEVVVAHVHLDLVVVDVHDVGAHGVEEVTVVADHDDSAVVVQQEVVEPLHGGNVQVVGGLVQQQDVGVAEQGLCQQHLHLETGVQGLHVVIVQVHPNAQALENAAGVGLGLVAAHLGVLCLEVGGPQAVLIGEVLLLVEGVHLPANLVQGLVAHDDRVQHGVGVIGVLVLLQHGHAHLGQDGHRAAGGLQLAGEDFQKGGFASAVGADDAVAVAPGELQVHVGEQGGALIAQGQIRNSNHVGLLYGDSMVCRHTPLYPTICNGKMVE